MGNLCVKDAEDQRTTAINRAIHRSHTEEDQVVKLLLLGASHAGKSTMIKQCRAIFDNGFPSDERSRFGVLVRQHLVSNLVSVVRMACDLQLDFTNDSTRVLCEQLVAREAEPVTTQTLDQAQTILSDKNIQLVMTKYRKRLQISDSAEYFFSNIERIKDSSYVATDEDIVRCRVPTSRVQELQFDLDDLKVRLVDVANQRGEKRKWLSCFSDVTAILYVVAANEFDLYFPQDESVNRLQESLVVFEEICSLPALASVPIILFFNKMDCLDEKLSKLSVGNEPPIVTYPIFRDFTDDENSLAGVQDHLAKTFLAVNKNPNRPIFKHFITAVNREEMQTLFEVVRDTILDELCGPEVI